MLTRLVCTFKSNLLSSVKRNSPLSVGFAEPVLLHPSLTFFCTKGIEHVGVSSEFSLFPCFI